MSGVEEGQTKEILESGEGRGYKAEIILTPRQTIRIRSKSFRISKLPRIF